MKKLSIALLFASLFAVAFAQEDRFFMPREIQQAYEKGTRAYDGKPGPNYWQNEVDYQMEVAIEPATRMLTGSATITLHNQSPDELSTLVLRLYHDAFRKGNPRGSAVRPSDITDKGMTVRALRIDGEAIDLEENFNRRGTNAYVPLTDPLAAGASAEIEVEWEMLIPQTTIRTGAYDSTSFFVAYWYPQVAVYDDVFGWDGLSYDFSTEFYNNLGDFDVKITAPTAFTVMATGVLQNAKEVFSAEKLALYQEAKTSDETVTIVSVDDALDSTFAHPSGTWHYRADEVTDFSFCLSDHFVWDAANQMVDGRSVLVSSFYNQSVAQRAGQLTANQQKTMRHFSEDVPGVPYPYPEFTTCVMGVGGGGMETPMMANNGGPGLGVTVHEMFHTYFPMYVRVNEKRFAWMDEGWADFNTAYVVQRYFQGDSSLMVEGSGTSVGSTLGSISDLPLITSTQFMDNTNYGYASYPLPAFVYGILHQHLGDELFRQCYRTYIERWAQKAPTPYDFFYTFEDVSGQDLSWVWTPWFFRYGSVDLAIASFNKGKLEVINRGNRPIPVLVEVTYADSSTWRQDYSGKIWEEEGSLKVKIPDGKNVASLSVNGSLPDAYILDNYYPDLQKTYGVSAVPEGVLGQYQMNEYPVNLDLSIKDGLYHARFLGRSAYLLPLEDGRYRSLNGSYEITLQDGDITVLLTGSGFRLTGSKM